MSGKILVIGMNSLIGTHFISLYPEISIGTTRKTDPHRRGSGIFLDIDNDLSTWTPPEDLEGAIILTAITSGERCRNEPEYTRKINVEQTINLIRILEKQRVFFIFPSTSLVCNGNYPFSGIEEDLDPKTEYGRQKKLVEDYITKNQIYCSTIRFSKILTPQNILIRTWVEDMKKGTIIQPFSDMFLSPIPMSFVCKLIYMIIMEKRTGLFQVSATDEISYADMASYIAKKNRYSKSLIQPVSWRIGAPDLEHVPLHTTLDLTRIREILAIPVPDSLQALDSAVRTYE